MYKHSSSEMLLSTCVSWITDEQLFMSWENKHLHGLQRIRFKHMYRKYQAKHLALGTVLVEESTGAARLPALLGLNRKLCVWQVFVLVVYFLSWLSLYVYT